MAVVERRLKNNQENSYFSQFASNITSQNGEDGILEKVFELIGTSSKPFCVDVGAWDGKHLSNSYNLVHNKNWSGLLIEANEMRCNEMNELYNDRDDVFCSNRYVNISGPDSLSSLLESLSIPRDFDFLSIDVDGADFHLWKSINGLYHPLVVCIEFNPAIPNEVYFVQEADTKIQQGSSLLAIVSLGKDLGYSLVATTLFNAIFVRNDQVKKLPEFDNSIEKIHSPSMVSYLFQTYDGELKLAGPKKLLWHKVAINMQKLQVLSKKDQKFPFAPPTQDVIHQLHTKAFKLMQSINKIMGCSSTMQLQENLAVELASTFTIALVEDFDRFISLINSEFIKLPHLAEVAIDNMKSVIIHLDNAISVWLSSYRKSIWKLIEACPNSNSISSSKTEFTAVVSSVLQIHLKASRMLETRADAIANGSNEEAINYYNTALSLNCLGFLNTVLSDMCKSIVSSNHISQSSVTLRDILECHKQVDAECSKVKWQEQNVRIKIKLSKILRSSGDYFAGSYWLGDAGDGLCSTKVFGNSKISELVSAPSIPPISGPDAGPSKAENLKHSTGLVKHKSKKDVKSSTFSYSSPIISVSSLLKKSPVKELDSGEVDNSRGSESEAENSVNSSAVSMQSSISQTDFLYLSGRDTKLPSSAESQKSSDPLLEKFVKSVTDIENISNMHSWLKEYKSHTHKTEKICRDSFSDLQSCVGSSQNETTIESNSAVFDEPSGSSSSANAINSITERANVHSFEESKLETSMHATDAHSGVLDEESTSYYAKETGTNGEVDNQLIVDTRSDQHVSIQQCDSPNSPDSRSSETTRNIFHASEDAQSNLEHANAILVLKNKSMTKKVNRLQKEKNLYKICFSISALSGGLMLSLIGSSIFYNIPISGLFQSIFTKSEVSTLVVAK